MYWGNKYVSRERLGKFILWEDQRDNQSTEELLKIWIGFNSLGGCSGGQHLFFLTTCLYHNSVAIKKVCWSESFAIFTVLLSASFSVSLILLLGFPYFLGDFLFAVSLLCLMFSPPFYFILLSLWFSYFFFWKCNLRVIFVLSFFLLTSPLLFLSSFSLTFHELLLWAGGWGGRGR
jgi:hypothetical protein